MSLEKFTESYLICALWSTSDESDDSGGDPLDKNYGPEDLSPECRANADKACRAFYEANSQLWADESSRGEWSVDEQAGHDFWLSRNGHGTGFFDREWQTADQLQDLAKACGEVWLCVGDDGQIHGHA